MNIITNSQAHPTVQITGCITYGIGDRILKRSNAFLEKFSKISSFRNTGQNKLLDHGDLGT